MDGEDMSCYCHSPIRRQQSEVQTADFVKEYVVLVHALVVLDKIVQGKLSLLTMLSFSEKNSFRCY